MVGGGNGGGGGGRVGWRICMQIVLVQLTFIWLLTANRLVCFTT